MLLMQNVVFKDHIIYIYFDVWKLAKNYSQQCFLFITEQIIDDNLYLT